MSNARFAVGDKVWDKSQERSGVVTIVDEFHDTEPHYIEWEGGTVRSWYDHVESDLEPYTGQDIAVQPENVAVDHPSHYTQYPHEVIEFTEHMNFCRGNAVKYIARAGFKDKSKEIEDLNKAVWYINREIARLEQS